MAFRIEARACSILIGLLSGAPLAFGQAPFRYEAFHVHSRVSNMMMKSRGFGTLVISPTGVSYLEITVNGERPKHPHAFNWNYQDIQQLQMAPRSITITTYKDNKWKLGADRAYRLDLLGNESFAGAAQFLKGRLDQRFVEEIPDHISNVLWTLPVKRLLRVSGEEGMIQVGANEIVYTPSGKGEARTWRYEDIDNISSSGPFSLTITTYERARLDYGSRKQFNFQLKQRLEEARYNDIWLRLNASQGLKVLQAYR